MADGGGGAVQEEIGRDMVGGQRKNVWTSTTCKQSSSTEKRSVKEIIEKERWVAEISPSVFNDIFVC